jgi:hypothetical protein
VVNAAIARRLLAATREDALCNAVVLLDLTAKRVPLRADALLDGLERLFVRYGVAEGWA